jgi:sugar phosphate isomerase/epimerase
MRPLLALSTCWSSHRHNDGYAMLREVADLGFTHVELSHGTRITLVPGVLRAVEEGVVKISSVHNFCPLPTGITRAAPNLFEPSAREFREHDQWLRHTKRTIDFAAQVGASAMVTHLGSVRFFWFDPGVRLRHWRRNHPDRAHPDDESYRKVLAGCGRRLRKVMPAYWTQVKASLTEIGQYALDKGVRVACENREKFSELPVDDDFAELFTSLPQPHPCAYWHDTGHAELKHRMGLLEHRAHLERLAPHLIGFHLHDVDAESNDHQPIGAGTIDFELMSEFWRPEHLLTLEFSPALDAHEVLDSKARVEALIARRFG